MGKMQEHFFICLMLKWSWMIGWNVFNEKKNIIRKVGKSVETKYNK